MSDEILPPEPRRSDRVSNPFGSQAVQVSGGGGALARSDQQKTVAEVQARMMIARSYPRDPIKAMDMILSDCTRPTLAKKALYQYVRGGTDISGPSIRLAEALAQRWGNIASGVKEVSRAGGYSECIAYAWDMESGFYDERQFQVRHWRDTKQGGYAITDERDIYELVANNGARRKRAALLTVIPGDVVEAAVEQCEETLAATADTTPEALIRMVEAFEQFEVTREQIEKRIQRRIEAIRPAQVIQLSKIFASLTDGMSAPADWFEVEGAAAGGGVWGAVDQAHATQNSAAPQAGTPHRRAPRKAAAKEPAPQERGTPPTDPPDTAAQGDTGQKPPPAASTGTQREAGSPAVSEARGDGPAAPPAASSKTSASAGETRTSQTGAAVGPSAPEAKQIQPESSGAPFAAWLIDGDGVAIDGTEDFTDPVEFAKAYAKAYADMFPPERKPFERANAESLTAARELSPYAVEEVLNPPKVQPAAETQQQSAMANELPLDAPHDMALIPKPTKPTRAAFVVFNEALKAKAATATELQLGHIQAVNTGTINGMPNAYRLDAIGILEARRKELTASAAGKGNGSAAPNIVEDLRGDVLSLTSAESVTTWLAMPRIKTLIANVLATDPPGWVRVMSAANSAYVRMRVEGCETLEAFQALDGDSMVDGAVGWLNQNDATEYAAIVDFIKQQRAGFPA